VTSYWWKYKSLTQNSKYPLLDIFSSPGDHCCYNTVTWYFVCKYNIVKLRILLLCASSTFVMKPLPWGFYKTRFIVKHRGVFFHFLFFLFGKDETLRRHRKSDLINFVNMSVPVAFRFLFIAPYLLTPFPYNSWYITTCSYHYFPPPWISHFHAYFFISKASLFLKEKLNAKTRNQSGCIW
jgi:hypothetical protein